MEFLQFLVVAVAALLAAGLLQRGEALAREIGDRLMASFGSMLLYWYHYAFNGRRIEVETDDDSIGGHFLHLLHGEAPGELWTRAMQSFLSGL